jgi:hypothetical protein
MTARSPSTRFKAPQPRSGLSFPAAIALLRNGALLRLEYDRGRPSWSLGDGQPVSPETVSLLISCGDIEPDDDALIPGTPSQTWRLRR